MARHIDTVGILWIALGAFQIVMALLFTGLFLLLGLGMVGVSSHDHDLAVAGGIYAIIGPVFGALIGLFGVLNAVCGVGLRRRTGWGRILGFICSFLAIGSIPIGTVVAVFTLMVLFDGEASKQFSMPADV